jgi:hypothetical protein
MQISLDVGGDGSEVSFSNGKLSRGFCGATGKGCSHVKDDRFVGRWIHAEDGTRTENLSRSHGNSLKQIGNVVLRASLSAVGLILDFKMFL